MPVPSCWNVKRSNYVAAMISLAVLQVFSNGISLMSIHLRRISSAFSFELLTRYLCRSKNERKPPMRRVDYRKGSSIISIGAELQPRVELDLILESL